MKYILCTFCELLAATNEVRVAFAVGVPGGTCTFSKISNQPLWMFEVRVVSATQVHRRGWKAGQIAQLLVELATS